METANMAYRICSRCLMDTSDPDIFFDEAGVCNHCYDYQQRIKDKKYLSKKEPGAIDRLVQQIKGEGKRKKYDCIVGVSGGVDSTYTMYKVKQLGLRPLAVHLDNGWDSELAVDNVKKFLKQLDIDLHTLVLDWEEFKALQLAFLKASTPDSEIPSDHAIVASLYRAADEYGIRFILSGHNTATEGGGVAAWSQGHYDWGYIKGIYKLFTGKNLKKFPHIGVRNFIKWAVFQRIKFIPILDYFEYDKKVAIATIEKKLGWRNYGSKHYESIYTRFYQGYILVKKFGYDKKRLHLSALIWSGQLTREEAEKQMGEIDYPLAQLNQDREFVIKKLGISSEEFKLIMNLPKKTFWDYLSYKKIFGRWKWFMNIYHHLKRS
ncbi:MAG: N-acetyl sugar amidotransferase [Candidatus Izemoplasmatales bacterium]